MKVKRKDLERLRSIIEDAQAACYVAQEILDKYDVEYPIFDNPPGCDCDDEGEFTDS